MGPIKALLRWADSRPELPPTGYRLRRIHWTLDVTSSGVQLNRYDQTDAVPTMRRSGPRPMPLLAVDTATHVLGVAGGKTTGFWQQIADWAACATTSHPAVGAALAMLHMHGTATSDQPAHPHDRVAVRCEGIWLHRLPEAVKHWRDLLIRAKSGPVGLCVGCATAQPLATSLPNAIPAHLIPGAEHDVQMTVLPLGERKDGHLPICVPCGDRASLALETMLADQQRTIRFAGQHSAAAVFGVGSPLSDAAAIEVLRALTGAGR